MTTLIVAIFAKFEVFLSNRITYERYEKLSDTILQLFSLKSKTFDFYEFLKNYYLENLRRQRELKSLYTILIHVNQIFDT